MKQFLIFIGGMIAGALLLYAIGFRKESSVREQIARQLIEKLSDNSANQDAEVQYIEVKGKKGNVTLHTGMTKDSVRLLVGKPDNVALRSYGNALEDWGYKIRNNYVPDLEINFEAGKLKSLRQD
ncbi:MAG: hypothetical protein JSR97_01750 [Verrucomicrobia bacterium]|jgi:hypothetical protein|nr:hypothetical protein [Verrucomicrobiota bacterium]